MSLLSTPAFRGARDMLPHSIIFWVVSHMYTKLGWKCSRHSSVLDYLFLSPLPFPVPRSKSILPPQYSFLGGWNCSRYLNVWDYFYLSPLPIPTRSDILGYFYLLSFPFLLGVSYPHNVLFWVVTNMCTKFYWICSRHSRINYENTHTYMHPYIYISKERERGQVERKVLKYE